MSMQNELGRVVRFAPSPTGHLHIGGVRTALFNFLFVKNQGGSLVLRIEDTDRARSDKKMADEIINGLQWLGLNWDQGPFFQSDYFDLYRETADHLLQQGKAYRCFCTPEEMDARRQDSKSKDKSQHMFKYDRKCLNLSQDDINKKLLDGSAFVIRFQVPQGMTFFKDRIHKEMKTDNTELDDFVLLKSDNTPTYHLSVVVDDQRMGITDVVRGDDHLSNTFKQVLLFKALDLKAPRYAHLPLILGADKKKLSKRHGETSVLEFKRAGYLPEALINYLSQLSWLPADTKKIFAMEELIKLFSLSKLSKNSPVFDYDKLNFLNAIAIQQKDPKLLFERLCEDEDFQKKYAAVPIEKKIRLIQLVKPRMKALEDFKQKFDNYLSIEPDYAASAAEIEGLEQKYSRRELITNLKKILPFLETCAPFDATAVEESLRKCAEAENLKAADLIHPARLALTMETVSPSIFAVFEFFGKESALKRIKDFIRYLE